MGLFMRGKERRTGPASRRKLHRKISPTGVERFFPAEEFIVSKTDLKGNITYANDVFLKVAGYSEHEIIGAPHSIIRHPHMPRCVFKLLWDTISDGDEIFAYVINMATNGDHYWVLAHVTPSYDNSGAMIGYHSCRRKPDAGVVSSVIAPLYQGLREAEEKAGGGKAGMAAGTAMLLAVLEDKGVAYDELIFSLAA